MMVDDIVLERGPVIGLTEFYTEFLKMYPNIKVNEKDFEKTINSLSNNGYLEELSQEKSGYKIVKIKPIKMTPMYQEILTFVSLNKNYLNNGVKGEDMVRDLKINASIVDSTLDEMTKNDIAWKHENKYYFPGLSKEASEIKLEIFR